MTAGLWSNWLVTNSCFNYRTSTCLLCSHWTAQCNPSLISGFLFRSRDCLTDVPVSRLVSVSSRIQGSILVYFCPLSRICDAYSWLTRVGSSTGLWFGLGLVPVTALLIHVYFCLFSLSFEWRRRCSIGWKYTSTSGVSVSVFVSSAKTAYCLYHLETCLKVFSLKR